IELCRLLYQEDSIFCEDFEKKINNCTFLTDNEKIEIIKKQKKKTEQYIFQPLKKLEILLLSLETKENVQGLSSYTKGLEYYEYLLERATGADMSAESMYEYLENYRVDIQKRLEGRVGTNTNINSDLVDVETVIEKLIDITVKEYPEITLPKYQLIDIPEFFEEKMYDAFYLRDYRKNKNYIYTDKTLYDQSYISMYQTIAHEAFPGHMYYYNFEYTEKDTSIDTLLKCMGYNEGWAVYAEFAVAEGLGEDKEEYLFMVEQKLLDEIFLCQLDIGIHGFGWNIEDVEKYMKEIYGITNHEGAENVMNILINNPAAYQSYVIGYFKMQELQEEFMQINEWSKKEFLEYYLKCGQAPFKIVEEFLIEKSL
ncbi:DUF885 domain-containing protein, partial [Lachnospiraceae bacterium OttesenSCG-928-D06]|nr:DUF885 domain-containing protein [Lachnospiraceae bacterium OttesenSCG-928-D06]